MTKIIAYYIFFALLALLVVSFFIVDEKVIFPNNNFNIDTYSDDYNGGKSNFDLSYPSDDHLLFTYELDSAYEYPYAGISLEQKRDFMNIADYDKMLIQMEAGQGKNFPVNLLVYCDGFTDTTKHLTYKNLTSNIEYEKGKEWYEISLQKFQVPHWWLKMHNMKDQKDFYCNLNQTQSINIQSCNIISNYQKDYIRLKYLAFKKVNYLPLIVVSILIVIAGAGIWFYYLKNKKKLTITYKAVESRSESDSDKLINYIADNYNNPDLTIKLIQKELGLNYSKISEQIRSHFNLTYKQYLNQIRLTEAKRLLKSTDYSVSEIAYKVGFNNVTHFNRVFKKECMLSPTEFRQQPSQEN